MVARNPGRDRGSPAGRLPDDTPPSYSHGAPGWGRKEPPLRIATPLPLLGLAGILSIAGCPCDGGGDSPFSFFPSSLDFGAVGHGTSLVRALTLRNIGDRDSGPLSLGFGGTHAMEF